MNRSSILRRRKFVSIGVMPVLTAMFFALPFTEARADVVLPKILGSKMVVSYKRLSLPPPPELGPSLVGLLANFQNLVY